jgi:F0F1-type ATP synthase membrane subunit b/b'
VEGQRLVAITTAIVAKLLLIDNYPGRPTPGILLTIALFGVCAGVVTGAGWARLLKVLEQRRRSAADTAAVAERPAKALEAVARTRNQLRRLVRLIEDGAPSWGSAVA